MLVYHNTGAGKTLTAMGIATAFWKTADTIFFVTTKKNIDGNPPSKYAENMLLFYPQHVPTVFEGARSLPPRDLWTKDKLDTPYVAADGELTVKMWCAGEGEKILTKKFKFMSFVNFSADKKDIPIHQLKTPGTWVVIIDEAQNMFKTLSKDREKQGLDAMRKLMSQIQYMKHSVVFPLTATPGDNPRDVINLINIVRPYGMPPVTLDEFMKNPGVIKGMVSYADVRGDTSKYGTLHGDKPINLEIPYTPEYFAAMLQYLETNEPVQKNLTSFAAGKGSSFFGNSRVASIMLPEKAFVPYAKNKNHGHEIAREPRRVNDGRTFVLSAKTVKMLDTIDEIPGCQYAYVQKQTVLKTLGTSFVRRGYQIVNLSTVNLSTPMADQFRTTRKRVLLYHGGAMIYPDSSSVQGGDLTKKKLARVLDFFNSSRNSRGEYIKAVVGTPFEGLDMSYLQAVHILSPLPTLEDDEQAVGRALRFCGHKEDSRVVKVFRYFGVAPRNVTLPHLSAQKQAILKRQVDAYRKAYPRGINSHVYHDARRRGTPMQKFMECVRSHSSECGIHPQKGGLLGPIQFKQVRCLMPRCEAELTKNGNVKVNDAKRVAEKVERELNTRLQKRNMEIVRKERADTFQQQKQQQEREKLSAALAREGKDLALGIPVTSSSSTTSSVPYLPVRDYTGPYKLSKIYVSPFNRRKYA